MIYVQIVLLVAGIVLLIAGYRRNHRKLMLIAAITLFLSGTMAQFATGFADGIHGTVTSWARN